MLADFADGVAAVAAAESSEMAISADVDAEATPEERKDARWFALRAHSGPVALEADGGSIFAHPMFSEHVAFSSDCSERGLLVAAGPVSPERGEGMTVVEGRARLAAEVDIVELATEDDLCVVGGLLTSTYARGTCASPREPGQTVGAIRAAAQSAASMGAGRSVGRIDNREGVAQSAVSITARASISTNSPAGSPT